MGHGSWGREKFCSEVPPPPTLFRWMIFFFFFFFLVSLVVKFFSLKNYHFTTGFRGWVEFFYFFFFAAFGSKFSFFFLFTPQVSEVFFFFLVLTAGEVFSFSFFFPPRNLPCHPPDIKRCPLKWLHFGMQGARMLTPGLEYTLAQSNFLLRKTTDLSFFWSFTPNFPNPSWLSDKSLW